MASTWRWVWVVSEMVRKSFQLPGFSVPIISIILQLLFLLVKQFQRLLKTEIWIRIWNFAWRKYDKVRFVGTSCRPNDNKWIGSEKNCWTTPTHLEIVITLVLPQTLLCCYQCSKFVCEVIFFNCQSKTDVGT